MVIKARRIIKIECDEKRDWFALGDEPITGILDRKANLYDQLNSNGGGIFCIDKYELAECVAELKGMYEQGEINLDEFEQSGLVLLDMGQAIEQAGENYIEFLLW